jgi:hypothetical protein
MCRFSAGVALIALTGCVHDGLWEGASDRNRVIKPPITKKQQVAQQQTAERVVALGRRVIDQNTFTGLEPVFHLVGVKDPLLFHRGTEELFISDGLVAKCRSDDELAAVLCTELGRMIAEKRAERALGKDIDPIAAKGERADIPGAEPVGTPLTAGTRPVTPADPTALADELMRGAGFDPVHLGRIEPILKNANRTDGIRKQMVGNAPAPVWKP